MNVLEFSTSHITESDNAELNTSNELLIFKPNYAGMGYFVYVENETDISAFSESFKMIMLYAIINKIRYIRFTSDAPINPDFKTHDW